jgi:hypothetical protein
MKTKSCRGVAAIELALVLPLFLALTFGMIDYGWYFFVAIHTSTAAREGARAASTVPGPCVGAATAAAQTSAKGQMSVIGYDGYTSVSVACSGPPASDPEYQVSVVVLFPGITGLSLVPLPKQGASLRAAATVTMRGVQ